MALTRLMARANKRQTRSMTKAAVNTKSSSQTRPTTKYRRPPARKRRARAAAAKRVSDATKVPVPVSCPASAPSPVPAQEDDEKEEVVAPAASPVVPAPVDQALRSAPSSPIIQQEQQQQSALEAPPTAIQQPSSPLQRFPSGTAPVIEQESQQQLQTAFATTIIEQSSASEAELPSKHVSLDFLKPRPESEPLNPLADWRQESGASGYLGTARMIGKTPNKRVIPDKVGPDSSLYGDDSSSDDDEFAPKPKQFVAMAFREIEGRTKGVLNSSIATPCSIAVTFELRELTDQEKKNEAELVFKTLKGNSLIMRNAERKRQIRRKPYFWFNKRVEKNPRDAKLRKLTREKKRGIRVERLKSGLKGWEMTWCYDASPLGLNVFGHPEEADSVVESSMA